MGSHDLVDDSLSLYPRQEEVKKCRELVASSSRLNLEEDMFVIQKEDILYTIMPTALRLLPLVHLSVLLCCSSGTKTMTSLVFTSSSWVKDTKLRIEPSPPICPS